MPMVQSTGAPNRPGEDHASNTDTSAEGGAEVRKNDTVQKQAHKNKPQSYLNWDSSQEVLPQAGSFQVN